MFKLIILVPFAAMASARVRKEPMDDPQHVAKQLRKQMAGMKNIEVPDHTLGDEHERHMMAHHHPELSNKSFWS